MKQEPSPEFSPRSLFDRGLRVQGLAVASHPASGHSGGLSRSAIGGLPYDLGLRATFGPEDLLTKLGKLFRREIRTGDETFDGLIHVDTEEPEPVAVALQDRTLRTAIVHAVDETGGSVLIDGSRVSYEGVRLSEEGLRRAVERLEPLLAALERHALAHQLPAHPELASFPDLSARIALLEGDRAADDTRFRPKMILLQDATLDGLAPLSRLDELTKRSDRRLEIVRLRRSYLADGDLSVLADIASLRELELTDVSGIAEPQLAALQRARPDLAIQVESLTAG